MSEELVETERRLFNPFPGLRPFEAQEAHLFFGRDGQSEELLRRLSRTRFIGVVGTSGSGKSSLVRAGLLPLIDGGFMMHAGSSWRIAVMRPGNDPIGSLAEALSSPKVLGNANEDAHLQKLMTEGTLRRSALGLIEATRLAQMAEHENLLVVVDQFEELFTHTDKQKIGQADMTSVNGPSADEKAAFVKLLLEAGKQKEAPIYIVLTMRSDYLGDCAQFRDLPEALNDGQYLTPRMTRDQRRQAIMGPVAVGGGAISPRLVQRLLNDAGDDPDQLPILQHALMRTWEHWEKNKQNTEPIDILHYEAVGTVTEALSRHADDAYNSLPDERSKKIAEKLFKCLSSKGPDNREVRRPTTLGTIAAVANAGTGQVVAVIDEFRTGTTSFIMPPAGVDLTPDRMIDISHESLIRQWKRLLHWVEEEAESRSMYLRVMDAAVRHQTGKAGLWRDPDLKFALEWQAKHEPNHAWSDLYDSKQHREETTKAKETVSIGHEQEHLTNFDLATKFLEQSKKQQEAEAAAREKERLAREQQRRRKVKALTAGLVAALLLLAFAGYEWWQATQQRQAAEGQRHRALVALSKSLMAQQLDVALLLALEAYKMNPNVNAEGQLFTAVQHAGPLKAYLRGHKGVVTSVAFSPDGTRLASGSGDRTIRLWDVKSGQPVGELLQGHKGGVTSVAFSPDGTRLASGSGDRTIRLWDVKSGQPVGEPLQGHKGGVTSVAFSPDGMRLASGSGDRTIRLWDVKSGQPVGELLEGHHDFVTSVAFSPDGMRLASGSGDGTIRLWDVKSGQPVGELLRGHKWVVTSVAFSPDGTRLASGSGEETIRLWDVKRGQPVGEPLKGHQSSVASVAFSPDGTRLASGSYDETIRLWDVTSGQPVGEPLKGHQGTVTSVAFSPDGTRLASGSGDRTIRLWDVTSGQPVGELLRGHTWVVTSVAFSPDGTRLASGSGDRTIRLWDVTSGQPVGEPLQGHKEKVTSVAFSPDGTRLASGSGDQTIRLWDVTSGRLVGELLEGHKGVVASVAFSQDGMRLASGSGDETIRLWDVTSGQPVGEPLRGHKGVVTSVAFSPDGTRLASGSGDETIRLWDVTSGQPVGELLQGHKGGVTSVAFSPDGTRLASGSGDQTIRLWDVKRGQLVGELLEGHKGVVTSVAFSPDGTRLASGSYDETIRLWDVTSGQRVGEPLQGHKDGVISVAFSPDGTRLASGSWDQTIRLWDLSIESWKTKACRIATNRNMTKEEWKQYMGDPKDYHKTCPDLPIPADDLISKTPL